MVNRIQNYIAEEKSLRETVRKGGVHPRKFAELTIRLKQIVSKIMNFGQRYKIVKVICLYVDLQGDKHTMEVYFTDIEEYEAIDYVKYRLEGELIEITAHKIPVGKPIKT